MRSPANTDFFVVVPEVGTFRFGRRTYGDRLRIRSNFLTLAKVLGEDDAELSGQAGIIAAYKQMCVECPPGWEDIEKLDMAEDAEGMIDRILAVYSLWRETEDSFRIRKEPAQNVQGSGEGNGQDQAVLVSPEVQPVASGPALP
jgi:hypothetical protein